MPNRLLDCVRRAALLRDGGGLRDAQLLALFVRHRDGDAFAALVNRHGPMVLGVCRRLGVGNRPDRVEPRRVKRRPKPYPRLTKPRAQARQALPEK